MTVKILYLDHPTALGVAEYSPLLLKPLEERDKAVVARMRPRLAGLLSRF